MNVTVELVEALGADSLVHGQLEGRGQDAAVTVRVDGARPVSAGETLHVAVVPEHVHFFDPDSGNRLA